MMFTLESLASQCDLRFADHVVRLGQMCKNELKYEEVGILG